MGASWRWARARALVVGATVLAGTVALPAGPVEGATAQALPPAPPPVITVTPSAGLEVGDTVTVEGSGFPPASRSTPAAVHLCAASPVDDLAPGIIWTQPDALCAVGRSASTGEDGSFTLELPITTARAPVVWAAVTTHSGGLAYDFHARVATAPVEVAPPAGDTVTVTVEPTERYADHEVTVQAIFEGMLPEPGSAEAAECEPAVLDAPADPAVVAGACDDESGVPVTPDAVGEVVATLPASAGTGAVRVGGRSPDGTTMGGAAPLTVYDPQVTVTPSTGLVEGQAVRVRVDELRIPVDPTWRGWEVYQCERSILDELPHAYPSSTNRCTRPVDAGEVDAEGRLDVEHAVLRYVEVARGTAQQRIVDCAAAPEACVVMVAGTLPNESWEVGFAAPVSFAPAPPVVVTLLAGAVTEGDTGTVTGDMPIVLNRPVDHPVTVTYRTFGNASIPWAARVGEDVVLAEDTLTLAPGETSATVPVQVVGDTRPEPTEMALVGLREATGAAVGGYAGIGGVVITDDD